MKILWINWRDIKNPKAGGAEVHLHEMSRGLVKRGHDVSVLASKFENSKRREVIDGYKVIRRGGWKTFSLSAIKWVKRNECKFDVIIEDINKLPLYIPFMLHDPKIVAFTHHLNRRIYFEEVNPLFGLAFFPLESMMPFLYTKLLKVPLLTVSKSTRRELIKLRADPQQITCIYNGINYQKYDAETPPSWDQKTPYPSLLYIDRLKRYKQPTHALLAFKLVKNRFPQAKLFLAGKGELYEKLKDMTKKLGLGRSVKILGFVSHENKVELYKKSWIHVETSMKEGWGLTNIEAAACGTPTVAYSAPGINESIIQGRTGILVNKRSPKMLGKAILRLISKKEKLKEMSRKAYTFSKRFRWKESIKELEEFLKRLVSNENGN